MVDETSAAAVDHSAVHPSDREKGQGKIVEKIRESRAEERIYKNEECEGWTQQSMLCDVKYTE